MYGYSPVFICKRMEVALVATRAKNAIVQYSKKMCTGVTIFWILYRLINFIVVLVRPETAPALADLCAGVDTIMIVNMGTYTANSSTEKIAIAYSRRKSLYGKSDDDDSSDEDEESNEESDNG